MSNEFRIYLGCDLFTEGQRWQANSVQKVLEERFGDKIYIYNPADNDTINDKESGFSPGGLILVEDYLRLKESDLLIALMDTEDIGLVAEMGIAFERRIPIFQLYTDIRLSGNQHQGKLQGLYNDVFQNDFLYINKLVTALSYLELSEDGKGVQVINPPRIYKDRESLVKAIIEFIDNKLEEGGD